jgi:hypothetical protein
MYVYMCVCICICIKRYNNFVLLGYLSIDVSSDSDLSKNGQYLIIRMQFNT